MTKVSGMITPAVARLGSILEAKGFEARVVGGAVRDFLQGKQPKDYDMATTATPEQVSQTFKAAGLTVIPTGWDHGTVTVMLDHEPYEITTLRLDTETDGRHAVVQFTTDWEADAARRDLTYNAMSVGMDGTLYDYFGGQEDLRNQTTRFVGDPAARMQEDYLRILRFFRFAGQSTAEPVWDEDTLVAIQRHARGLKQISVERIWVEMKKILVGKWRVNVMGAMWNTFVLDAIGFGHGENSTFNSETIEHFRKIESANPIVMMACFTANEGMADSFRQRWKLSTVESRLLRYLIAMRFSKVADVKYYLALSTKDRREEARSVVAALAEFNMDPTLLELLTWEVPERPVDGIDLLNFGVQKGPKFGKMLQWTFDRWAASGYVATKSELMHELTALALKDGF